MTPTPIDDYLDRLRRALARWGYEDARLAPRGSMTEEQIAEWTLAIDRSQ